MIGVTSMNGKQISWEAAPELLRIGQASQLVGAHAQTLRGWIHSGLLTAHRTGGGHFRIRKADLRTLWENRQRLSEADRLGAKLDKANVALRRIAAANDLVEARRLAKQALAETEGN